ncbi:MAG: diacylglycerol/polyprenol kinase family protein [Pseudobdellovibrio sp.]
MVETNLTLSGLKNRSDLHVARKIWHMSGVFTMFAAWSFLPYWVSMTLLIVGWLLFVPADFLRQKNPEINRSVMNVFRPIMRSSELNRLAGTTYLITGTLLITIFFNKGVVALSLLFLAFADPIASYVGIKYGKDKLFGHKSVQGFVAAFVVCAVICYAFLFYNQVQEYILIVSLLAGLIGALAELIPLAKLDDNFTMPVVSSIGLSVLFYFFGYFSYFN